MVMNDNTGDDGDGDGDGDVHKQWNKVDDCYFLRCTAHWHGYARMRAHRNASVFTMASSLAHKQS